MSSTLDVRRVPGPPRRCLVQPSGHVGSAVKVHAGLVIDGRSRPASLVVNPQRGHGPGRKQVGDHFLGAQHGLSVRQRGEQLLPSRQC